MKHCPECKSDSVERVTSTGARVVFCIILLIIPFGFFICWAPFVFPHRYRCNVCGSEGNEEMLVDLDWRDKQALLEETKVLDQKLTPILNYWFIKSNNLYKVVSDQKQTVLLEFINNTVKTYFITDYAVESATPMLFINAFYKRTA